ncbi:hypothetical protein ASU35_10550 [Acetivibrio ethanolgignens]|uniref:histidine kinase n=1 Tax=Acetivibrio ethanolgignens TaxID=290052 RepID=A0A0V8QEF7_9FIRM|nr:ATP-binding protein [Acetivibrio ethanolgignens]KSV58989.1 hypothetical protein ASU35_10550 [Acetivibrio ethanolgignens]
MDEMIAPGIELEAMLRSMNNGVVAINHENQIIFYNQVFLTIIGRLAENIKLRPFYEVIRNEIIFDAIDVVRQTGKDGIREGEWKDKIIRATATPLVGKEENLGILVIVEDITQLKKLESVRSDFVSNVTHELKTPLTSIRGFVETLRNGAIADEAVARKFLDIIDIETERLSSLIQDILTLSEIESGEDHEAIACNVGKAAQEVVELLTDSKEGVQLIYEPVPYIRPYTCNPVRIKELLINLLDNAIKYTEEGYVRLICREDGEELLICVEDTGIGMEKEHLPRIFERFYRIDKSRSRKQGGTGLGLSIVKHIVELYNGRIRVESKVGLGTRFEIRLPY